MSDGSYNKTNNIVRIYTNSFTKEEVQLLANSIKDKFNIYVGVGFAPYMIEMINEF